MQRVIPKRRAVIKVHKMRIKFVQNNCDNIGTHAHARGHVGEGARRLNKKKITKKPKLGLSVLP